MARKTLEPAPKPLHVNIGFVIFMIIIFAIIFYAIGVWGMHYPMNQMTGVI